MPTIWEGYVSDVDKWIAGFNGYRRDAPPVIKLRAWLRNRTGEKYSTATKHTLVEAILKISGKN